MNVSIQRILSLKFLPIIDIESVKNPNALIETMLEQKVNILQMNFKNLQQVESAIIIEELHQKYPEMHIGGGFLNTSAAAKEVIKYGAKFLVSSILAKDMLKASLAQNIPTILSGFTLTEIYEAHATGSEMVQIFPAAQLHSKSIIAILEYLPNANFILTGGLSVSTALDVLRHGARAVGVKGSIFPKEHLVDENYVEIGRAIKNLRDRVQQVELINLS